tara:strand:- start:712 stop:1341 length:630 start_codon:yes stop_codon:yes gene_type:complete
MHLKNYFWYFSNCLPHHFCDEVIKHAKTKIVDKAVVGEMPKKVSDLNKKQIKTLNKSRNSDIVWLDEPWINRQIIPFVQKANKNAGWNVEIENQENAQFTIYGPNQHYGWHCDAWREPYDRPKSMEHGLIRKLSVTVSLSDLNDYEGGDFEFDFRDGSPQKKKRLASCRDILPKGSILVFPSFVWHRVKPVMKGLRHSLVVWYLGQPYR